MLDFNPAAEAFKNFESESQSGMMSSLHLDHDDDRRRGTSRANSVRFDESAMNHYGASSRQSMEMLPVRTGSGMGMSERSYSHRSDGRGSTSGLSMRANSFGLETGPKVSANPPPGFLFLGPVPSIIRCWLSDDFSNDSVRYAAVCTGSYGSSISRGLIQHLGLEDDIHEEGGSSNIRLFIHLTEATIQHSSSSRSSSPVPQVPALTARFNVYEASENDPALQVFIGSDVLRAHNADVLFSEDRLLIFDDERNRLAVPLVRPESEATYRSLSTTGGVQPNISVARESEKTPSRTTTNGQFSTSTIRSPPKFDHHDSATGSPAPNSPAIGPDADEGRVEPESSQVLSEQARKNEDNRSITGSGSEKSFTATKSQTPSGVWGNSWRTSSAANLAKESQSQTPASGYARATTGRNMKVLRPSGGKSMANSTRATSATGNPFGTGADAKPAEQPRQTSQTSLGDVKAATKPSGEQAAVTTKANPIGQASAFGWLNSGSRGTSRANNE